MASLKRTPKGHGHALNREENGAPPNDLHFAERIRNYIPMTQPFAHDVTVDGVRGRGESLALGFLAGLIAAAVGAGLWMAVTVMLNVHVGYVALAVGVLVGFSIRMAGNGRSAVFGIIGALLTLAGCLGGEVLA